MSDNDESFSDEELSFEDDQEDDDELSEEEKALSDEDLNLFFAVLRNDADAARQALRGGSANVDSVLFNSNPLCLASERGFDQIIRILLKAGADAWWRNDEGESAIFAATRTERFSTVQLLIHHDNGLLEITNNDGYTPLCDAILTQNADLVRLLLDLGANAHHVDHLGLTPFLHACHHGSLETFRLLLAAGVDVQARDIRQRTALHLAAGNNGSSAILLELILQHNADMFAVDVFGRTPFDWACRRSEQRADVVDHLLEIYANKSTQDHGRLALHELLKVAKYSFVEDEGFHPPLNPLQIILPLGKLTLKHLRTLLHYTLDPELVRNRDATGNLPLHIACQTNAPVEVLALILELDPTTVHIADCTSGALPIHLLCGTTTTAATEYANVRYLVEQTGGVGILAARNRKGLLPLHVLLSGCTNPPLRTVQYLMQSFPGSVAIRTNAGEYPFMIAAAGEQSLASLSVVYEILRVIPNLVVPR